MSGDDRDRYSKGEIEDGTSLLSRAIQLLETDATWGVIVIVIVGAAVALTV